VCAAAPESEYLLLADLAQRTGYTAQHLGWLIRQGGLAADKRGLVQHRGRRHWVCRGRGAGALSCRTATAGAVTAAGAGTNQSRSYDYGMAASVA